MKFFQTTLTALFLAAPAAVSACDSCAIYSALETQGSGSPSGFFGGVALQYTGYGDIQINGHDAPNPTGQYLDSYITQFIGGYHFNPQFSLQLNVPYIDRVFKRPEGFSMDEGSVNGLGDLSIIGRYEFWRIDRPDFTLAWDAMAGLKLPTGNPDRIREEFNEMDTPGAPESGIHGHDLALGSGSVDGIVGGSVFGRYQRFYGSASFQYALRATGASGYRYANEFSWEAGAGYYVVLSHEGTLAIGFVVTGEDKGMDRFLGEKADDTGMHAIYVGPKITGTWHDHLSADLAAELPVKLHNSAFQSVPDVRVRTGVTWRF